MKKQMTVNKSVVEYDSETGIFTWVLAYRKPWLTSVPAGRAMSNGYLYMCVGGKNISVARSAWELVNGPIPKGLEIDHINRNKTDNRIENLRIVNRNENLKNRVFAPNACGVTGVSVHRQSGLYRARYKNKTVYAETLKKAARAYENMRRDDDAA